MESIAAKNGFIQKHSRQRQDIVHQTEKQKMGRKMHLNIYVSRMLSSQRTQKMTPCISHAGKKG